MFNKLLILLVAISVTSCATTYRNINPKELAYSATDKTDDIKLEYRYDVLQKKYAKKEKKKGIKVVSAKITNTSTKDLTLGDNLIFQNGSGAQVVLLQNDQIFKPLKQNVATYLLYLLLSVTTFNKTTTDSDTGAQRTETVFPIGLIIGPGITALNMITAGTANKKFKMELEKYNLSGKTIKAGETIHGVIGIRSQSYDNLKLVIR